MSGSRYTSAFRMNALSAASIPCQSCGRSRAPRIFMCVSSSSAQSCLYASRRSRAKSALFAEARSALQRRCANTIPAIVPASASTAGIRILSRSTSPLAVARRVALQEIEDQRADQLRARGLLHPLDRAWILVRAPVGAAGDEHRRLIDRAPGEDEQIAVEAPARSDAIRLQPALKPGAAVLGHVDAQLL